jgi:hypothetical protein
VRRRALYLGANPPGTVSLGLDEEVRAILHELRSARYRCFELVARWTSEASDLVRELRESSPVIVHLSGHACQPWPPAAAGGHTGALECGGALALHAPDGSVHVLSYAVVKEIFERAGSSVKLVVLTACNTEPLASLLLEHVDCVIGIDGPIGDRAALEFSKGLYAALGGGAAIDQAVVAGRLAIHCAGLPDVDRPVLKVREGVDASRVVLAVIPRRRKPRIRRPSVSRVRSGRDRRAIARRHRARRWRWRRRARGPRPARPDRRPAPAPAPARAPAPAPAGWARARAAG